MTKIEWCDHTFNPWRGCMKVSPGCANCYAERLSARNPAVLGEWGPTGRRAIASESYWRQPLRWDRRAAKEGRRARVFCASLADVLEDREELDAPRSRLLEMIAETPHVDWLLLTKRPEHWRPLMERLARVGVADGDCLAEKWRDDDPPANVWLGVSVEDQERAESRIPELLSIPSVVRWVSYEPALGPVDFRPWMPGLDWIVVGGESGFGARPFDVAWARSTVERCRAAGVACFVKQLGRHPRADGQDLAIRHPKGGDPAEWPADLRVRQWPTPR